MVRAVRPSIVWVLERSRFREIVKLKRALKIAEYQRLIESVELISSRLTEEQKGRLAESLEEVFFLQDEEIVRQGEVGDTFFVIFEGECSVMKDDNLIAKLSKGS